MDCNPQIHIAAIHSQAGYSNETRGLAILCRKEDYFSVVVALIIQISDGQTIQQLVISR
jgi:hypothetical protein